MCLFTGWKSRDDVPKLVTDFLAKKFDLDQKVELGASQKEDGILKNQY